MGMPLAMRNGGIYRLETRTLTFALACTLAHSGDQVLRNSVVAYRNIICKREAELTKF
jgi:hypothetical protein